MLKQPLVWDLDEAGWRMMLGAPEHVHFVSITYWNRQLADNGGCAYTIHANNTSSMGNGVVVNNLPEPLNEAAYLKAMLKAEIEVFGADLGEVWTSWPGHAEDPIVLFWHWLWWVREGQAWPPDHPRFNQAQGNPSSAEPWLGGTLYTWPEYEPWHLPASA